MVMLKKTLFLSFFIAVNAALGQTFTDSWQVRTLNQSLVLQKNTQANSGYVFQSYGELSYNVNGEIELSKYLFHSQEYDQNLKLNFYPSRIYSAIEKRFFQPDPESQNFSSYLFVNADPVNNIDQDGNVSRPLVLYQEDHSLTSNVNESMADLMKSVPDAHYVPLSDFVSGRVGDLPEWNGNVFIKGHMWEEKGREIYVELAQDYSQIKTPSEILKSHKAADGLYENGIGAEDLGGMIRRFADERGVQVHNIVAGGCDGSVPAKRIGKGFKNAKKIWQRSKKRAFNVIGLKKNHQSLLIGSRSTEGNYFKELQTTRFYGLPDGFQEFNDVEGEFPFAKMVGLKQAREMGVDGAGQTIYGPKETMPYVEGDELVGLMNGEVARQIQPLFDRIPMVY